MARIESKVVVSPYTGQEETHYTIYRDNGDFVASTYDSDEAYGKYKTRAENLDRWGREDEAAERARKQEEAEEKANAKAGYAAEPDIPETPEIPETMTPMSSPPIDIPSDTSIIQPINYTDPFVYHDSSLGNSVITRLYQPSNSQGLEEGVLGTNEPYDTTHTDGIEYPLIKFNITEIEPTMIEYMKISYDYEDFFPSILLVIHDHRNVISFSDTPGANNKLTVKLLPSNEGVYKKISIDFHIDRCDFDRVNNTVVVTGKYQFLPFEQTISGAQIKYKGCNNQLGKTTGVGDNESEGTISCNTEDQIKPNMWEMLHEICRFTGLGFASTDKVKDIDDRLPRVINVPMTFPTYIKSQLEMSGVDEDSMFDCWIDLYGYLVIVNVAYVLNEDIKYQNLAIKSNVGLNPSDPSLPKSRTKMVHRTLTNFNQLGEPSDLEFDTDSFEEIIDNNQKYSGYTQNDSSIGIRGASDGINAISSNDVTRSPESIDDQHTEDYETCITKHCTNRIDIEYNTNLQKTIRENFFIKQRSKRYKLRLKRPNYGLCRGTLINVSYFTLDDTEKNIILQSSSNLDGIDTADPDHPDTAKGAGMSERDIISNDSVPVPVLQKSGMYYIDGMTFEYEYDKRQIVQTLYLIKKGNKTNLNNRYTEPRLDEKINNNALTTVNVSSPQIIPANVQFIKIT